MDESDNNGIHRSLQVERSCNALWPQGQGDDSTICSFDSYHHCVGCSSPSLDIQHKSTPKSEMQLQGKSSNEEIRKPSRISGENAVGSCGQDYGNGRESGSSSNYDKSHIFHSEGQHQELLFRGINSWQAGRDERRESTDIRREQTSSEEESKNDEINVFQCPNREKIEGLPKFLGPVFRIGTMVGSSWKENYPRTSCYFVFPDSRPKWRYNSSMFSVSNSDRFDSSCNNPTLVVEMFVNESDRCRIATSLDIEIQSSDIHKDNIHYYIMEIALCGFNHIIIIGKCYCGLLFLDCYERVFRWDSMTGVLLFIGNFFKAVSEKPCEVVWGVSGDGTVWELELKSDSDSSDECNSHLVKDKKKDKKKGKKKGKNKNQKKRH